jgi:hypothetical protein
MHPLRLRADPVSIPWFSSIACIVVSGILQVLDCVFPIVFSITFVIQHLVDVGILRMSIFNGIPLGVNSW